MADTAPAPTVPVASTASEVAEAGVDAPAAAAPTPAQTAEMVRMLKLKLDGYAPGEDEAELPESEVLKLASHNAKTLIDAKKAQAKLLELERRLKEDPDALLSEMGLDLDARAIERLNRKVQEQLDEEMLSPAERKARELEAKLAKYEQAEKEKAENETKSKAEAQRAKMKDHYANVISESLALTKLPKTPETATRLAKLLQRNVQNDLAINPAILARELEAEIHAEAKPVFSKMNPEALADFVGPEALRALVKVFAKRQGASTLPKAPAAPAKKTREQILADERKALNAMFNGKRK